MGSCPGREGGLSWSGRLVSLPGQQPEQHNSHGPSRMCALAPALLFLCTSDLQAHLALRRLYEIDAFIPTLQGRKLRHRGVV